MRQLPNRTSLPTRTIRRLGTETEKIAQSRSPKESAERQYTSARRAAWFRPVVDELAKLSGPGQRCMLCSGSEASQVEHYRPKAVFPVDALKWDNFLWSCGICNQNKSDRFPPDTEPGGRLINPLDENVWDFVYLDEFGFVTAKWIAELNSQDPRGLTTETLLKLNRQSLQESRLARMRDLRLRVEDTLKLFRKGRLKVSDLRMRLQLWKTQPFQPDVADFFFNGPGRVAEPFRTFLELSKTSR